MTATTDTAPPPAAEPDPATETLKSAAPAPAPAPAPPPALAEVDRAPDMARGVLRDASIDARIRYARTLADANLLPEKFRSNPPNVFYAIEYGNLLGIHPLAAITGIHVMDGKPTASAALMSALVRRAGHKLRVRTTGTVEGGDLATTAEIIRSDDPDFTFSATWTLQRAQRAGLIDRLDTNDRGETVVVSKTSNNRPSNWEKFPEAMTVARSLSEVSRAACEEALCGVHYTPEELGARVNEEGEVIEGEVVETWEGPQTTRPPAASLPTADEIRAQILGARTIEDLSSVFKAAAEIQRQGGPRADAEIADEKGEATTIEGLFRKAGQALKAGAPLVPSDAEGGGDGPQGDEDPPGAPAQPETPPEGPSDTGEAAQPPAQAEAQTAETPLAEAPTVVDSPLDLPADGTGVVREAPAEGRRRNPYVGSGVLGCLASARIDREEADGLAWHDDRRNVLEASALAWEAQAETETVEGDDGGAAARPGWALAHAAKARLTDPTLALDGAAT